MKLVTLVFAAVFALSVVFLAASSTSVHANSLGTPSQVVPKTKQVTRRVYHRSQHTTVKTWHRSKHYTKKGWHKSNHIGHKVVRKTKRVVVGRKATTP